MLTVGQALARARCLAEEDRSRAAGDALPLPEYGVATLLAAGGDGPLVDPALPPERLPAATAPAGGRSVRELPMGALIGRRAQLRDVMGMLRRTPAAEREFGAASGVVLTGIGGIGKTALAGRVISRLRDDGWLIAVHEGRWNPTALIAATAQAIADTAARGQRYRRMRRCCARPSDCSPIQASDDGPKLKVVDRRCSSRLPAAGGLRRLRAEPDPGRAGLPGPGGRRGPHRAGRRGGDRRRCWSPAGTRCRARTGSWPRWPVPPLSAAELRRMFLRLPALGDLDPADQALLIRAIGGHPRLIEFTDALLRGGRLQPAPRPGPSSATWPPPTGVDLTPATGPWTRPSTRRWCWAAPTSCSPNCSPCSPRARPPSWPRSRSAAPR